MSRKRLFEFKCDRCDVVGRANESADHWTDDDEYPMNWFSLRLKESNLDLCLSCYNDVAVFANKKVMP